MFSKFVINFDQTHLFSFMYGLVTFATFLLGCIFLLKYREFRYNRNIEDYEVVKHPKNLLIGICLLIIPITLFFTYLNIKSDILNEHRLELYSKLEEFKTETIAVNDVVNLYTVSNQHCNSNSLLFNCFYIEAFSEDGLIDFYVLAKEEDFILTNQHNLYIDRYIIPENYKDNYYGNIAKRIYTK